ncbi:sensor histidine kinase [Microbulbifer agarilyticus]
MAKDNTTAGIIVRTYMVGALVLLLFYGVIFYNLTLYTEDKNSEKRLQLLSDYYSEKYDLTDFDAIQIDPLLTIYGDYSNLPDALSTQFSENWVGATTFHIDNDEEYSVLAQRVASDSGNQTIYFVEAIGSVELDQVDIILFQSMLTGAGIFLFLIAAAYITRSAKKIGGPISSLSNQLEASETDFSPISLSGHLPDETKQMLSSVNAYRARIKRALHREQLFTRYISHELRTPLTVIKGSLSVLRKSENDKTRKHVGLMSTSVAEMEELTQTFLLLAREKLDQDVVAVNEELVERLLENFSGLIQRNEVHVTRVLSAPFSLDAHPQLFSAVINNLLKNAINCSLGGKVSVFVSPERIDVIDNGVGLGEKPRGYEGFGIGLKIVNDICDKYGWTFQLKPNPSRGCTATVLLK